MAKKAAATPAATVNRLADLDTKLDGVASRAADDFTREVGRALGRWWRGAVRDLSLEESGGNLRRTRKNETAATSWAGRTRSAIPTDILPVIQRVTRNYISQGVSSALAGNRISGWDSQLTRQDQYLIDRLTTRRHRDMVDAVTHYVNQGQSAVIQAVHSSQAVREVRVELAELEDQMRATLYRMADRLVYELAQTVIARKAGVGSVKERKKDSYLYSGPIDRRCRNFCLAKVGRVWSKGAIDRMDNGQLPNTFITRGGYNCRHLWRPVEGKLALLADTGKFASADLQAQHRSVVAALRRVGGKTRRVA